MSTTEAVMNNLTDIATQHIRMIFRLNILNISIGEVIQRKTKSAMKEPNYSQSCHMRILAGQKVPNLQRYVATIKQISQASTSRKYFLTSQPKLGGFKVDKRRLSKVIDKTETKQLID